MRTSEHSTVRTSMFNRAPQPDESQLIRLQTRSRKSVAEFVGLDWNEPVRISRAAAAVANSSVAEASRTMASSTIPKIRMKNGVARSATSTAAAPCWARVQRRKNRRNRFDECRLIRTIAQS